MSAYRDEIASLLATAARHISGELPKPLISGNEEAEIEALIKECGTSSSINNKRIAAVQRKSAAITSFLAAEHARASELQELEPKVLNAQVDLSTMHQQLHALQIESQNVQHEINETMSDMEWEEVQSVIQRAFDQEHTRREISAIKQQAENQVRRLLANERNPHLTGAAKTPVHRAVIAGDVEKVKQLIADGADVNASDDDGNYPICDLLAYNNPKAYEILDLLIKAGVNLNQANRAGWTAMNFQTARLIGVNKDPRTLNLLHQNKAKGGANPKTTIVGWQKSSTELKLQAKAEQKVALATQRSKSMIGGGRLEEMLAQQRVIESLQRRINNYYSRQQGFKLQALPDAEKHSHSRPLANESFTPSKPTHVMMPVYTTCYSGPTPSTPDERNIFRAFFDGVVHEFEETGKFIGEEFARIKLGHETKTAATFTALGKAIGEDLAKWKSGEDSFLKYTLTERGLAQTINGAVEYSKENVDKAIEILSTASANDYAEFLGRATAGYGIAWTGGKAVEMAGQGLQAAASKPLTYLRDAKKAPVTTAMRRAEIPKTRLELHSSLTKEGFVTRGTSKGGYVEYKKGDITITIKPNNEVIRTQLKWNANKSAKYPERQFYNGERITDQSHSTGHFLDDYSDFPSPKNGL